MHRKLVVSAFLLVLLPIPRGAAQVTIDASRITCDQYVHSKIATPNYIAAWLSGYYNGRRNNRLIDLQQLQENVRKLEDYCSDEKNFKLPVLRAVERLFGKKD
jgi:acid stress chaperone HdeB